MKKIYEYVEPTLPLFNGILYALLMLSFFTPWIMLVVAAGTVYLLALMYIGAKNGW